MTRARIRRTLLAAGWRPVFTRELVVWRKAGDWKCYPESLAAELVRGPGEVLYLPTASSGSGKLVRGGQVWT